MERDYLITKFSEPGKMMNTQYGHVAFLEWLEYEQERLAKLGRRTVIVQRGQRFALAYS